jgi:molybdopterin-guanine dinucleotide biosynthesis protein B
MDGQLPVFCILGWKNSGKTELTIGLAAELNRRGRRVMTVKHGHGFQFDEAGRDSWRHRHEGGAHRTVMAAPGDFAVVGGWPGEEMPLRELVERFLWDGDVVLAEGYKGTREPRIVVFRAGRDPGVFLGAEDGPPPDVVALVTDDPEFRARIPVFQLGDPDHTAALADLLEERMAVGKDP